MCCTNECGCHVSPRMHPFESCLIQSKVHRDEQSRNRFQLRSITKTKLIHLIVLSKQLCGKPSFAQTALQSLLIVIPEANSSLVAVRH